MNLQTAVAFWSGIQQDKNQNIMTKKEEKKRDQVRHVVLRTTSGTGCVGKKRQRKKKKAI